MEYLINRGEVLTFCDAAAMEAVVVTAGRVWLTSGNDTRDFCLEAGKRLPIGKGGRIVIEALEDAAVKVVWRDLPAALRITLASLHQAPSGSSGSSR